MIGRVTEFRGGNRSRIAIVDGVMTVVPKIIKVRRIGEVLVDGEGITMLRVRAVVVVDVIRKGIICVIEAILSGIVRGAPSGSREGEAGMILGGILVVVVRDGICGRVVTDGLGVGGDGGLIIDYAGTVKELSLGTIASGIVLIGGMRVGRGV